MALGLGKEALLQIMIKRFDNFYHDAMDEMDWSAPSDTYVALQMFIRHIQLISPLKTV